MPAKIIQAPDLPRTINGKLVELAVRDVVHGRPVKNTDALANPQALDFFKELAELGSDRIAALYERECARLGYRSPTRHSVARRACPIELREQLIARDNPRTAARRGLLKARSRKTAAACSADCTCGAASAAARPG